MNIFIIGLFEFVYFKYFLKFETKNVDLANANDAKKIIHLLSNLPTYFGGIKFDLEKWIKEENLSVKYYEVIKDIDDIISERYWKIIFCIQMLTIYIVKLKETVIFHGLINNLIIFIFTIIIIWQLFWIFLTLSFSKLFRFLFKILIKHPSIKQSINI